MKTVFLKTTAKCSPVLPLVVFATLFSLDALSKEELLVDKLKDRGFYCKNYEDKGHLCEISKVKTDGFKYSQPVLIFIPKGIKSPNEVLLHMHGYRGVCEPRKTSPQQMFKNFQFVDQMEVAGRTNSVFVMPMSLKQCTTYNQELASEDQIKGLWSWIKETVEPEPASKFVVSGHSGAGDVLGRIVKSQAKEIDSAILLDATYYKRPEHISQWKSAIRENRKLRVLSVFKNSRKSKTASGNAVLDNALGDSYQSLPSPAIHCNIPKTEYGETLAKIPPPKKLAPSSEGQSKSGSR